MQAGNVPTERAFAYHILRYVPYVIRDEWVNIGILLFAPETGERRLRLIERTGRAEPLHRLHPQADECLLLRLRDDLEERFQSASGKSTNGNPWQALVAKWDNTLSNALQLSPQKGTLARDLDAELERLYNDHVAVRRGPARVGAASTRSQMRSYCQQVFRQARLWRRVAKRVPVLKFTGLHHRRISSKAPWKSEFAAITDVELTEGIPWYRFVRDILRDAGIEPIPLDHLAVWVAKLKPMIQ